MFESHFGLRENPFVAAHQARYIYPSPEHQEAIAHLRYGIENREPFVLITGEVGTGKTTALYDALSEWQGRAVVGLITNSSLTRAELLEEIGLRLGLSISAPMSKPQLMVQLERHLLAIHGQGHRAILLLDEAQNLEWDLLEEIRLLSNLEVEGHKLVQIFLVGQPELEAKLSRAQMRQLRQRISVHYRLNPLGADDTERYIHHRIAVAGAHGPTIFPRDACAEVHRLSHGIPREINHLCTQSMVNAFVEESATVRIQHVQAAASELDFQSVLGGTPSDTSPTPVASGPVATTPEPAPAADAAPVEPPPVAPPPPEGVPAPEPAVEDVTEPDPPIEESQDPAHVAAEPAGSTQEWQNWFDSLAEPPADDPPAENSPVDASDEPQPEPEATPEPEPATVHARVKEAPPLDLTNPVDDLTPERDEVDETPEPVHVPAQDVVPAAPTPTAPPEPPAVTAPPPPAPEPETPAAVEPAPPEPAPKPAPQIQPEPETAPKVVEAAAGLSPRLREKLAEQTTPTPRERSGLPLRLMLAASILALLVVGATLLQRFVFNETAPAANAEHTAGEELAEANESAVPEQTDAPALEESAPPDVEPAPTQQPPDTTSQTQAEASALAGGTTEQRETGSTPAGGVAAAAGAAAATQPPADTAPRPEPPAPSQTFTIAVGTYLNEDRAIQERIRLSDSSELATRLVTVDDNGGPLYRVLMGNFPSRAAAERSASDLIEEGLVNEARIIALETGSS